MKTIRIGAMLTSSLIATGAHADFIGWTSTVRDTGSGYLVNVFAATSSAGDRLVNVFGGSSTGPGYVNTNSAGGFLQTSGAESTFAPGAAQDWNALDSFLTVGGGLDGATGTWSPDPSTLGDPSWSFAGPAGTLNGFSTPSDPGMGISNPWTSAIPANAGWYLLGSSAEARSLGGLASIRLSHEVSGGVHFGASSGAAANAAYGMLVAQLFVAQLGDGARIDWNLGATVRRSNGTAQQAVYAFTVPGPGVANLALVAVIAARGRRRARR
jgi:hypothetical protein